MFLTPFPIYIVGHVLFACVWIGNWKVQLGVGPVVAGVFLVISEKEIVAICVCKSKTEGERERGRERVCGRPRSTLTS